MLVLTWNLFHGRSQPASRQQLLTQFAARLGEWQWDVALLQEVPPWWPAQLALASAAQQRSALTSRNSLLVLRRAVAERRPELIKSNGGGCNAILVRGSIVEHRAVRLARRPERRVAQLARLADGTCVANFHASTRVALAQRELEQLAELALHFAQSEPLVLGGDLNLRDPDPRASRLVHVADRDVDHLFARALLPHGRPQLLDRSVLVRGRRAELSDHPPLRVALQPAASDQPPRRAR
jgi:endonuclease/exonuclease/phosphatase family metal-dependent hydrolase